MHGRHTDQYFMISIDSPVLRYKETLNLMLPKLEGVIDALFSEILGVQIMWSGVIFSSCHSGCMRVYSGDTDADCNKVSRYYGG